MTRVLLQAHAEEAHRESRVAKHISPDSRREFTRSYLPEAVTTHKNAGSISLSDATPPGGPPPGLHAVSKHIPCTMHGVPRKRPAVSGAHESRSMHSTSVPGGIFGGNDPSWGG